MLPGPFPPRAALCSAPSDLSPFRNRTGGVCAVEGANACRPPDPAFLRAGEGGNPASAALPASPSGLPVGGAQPQPRPIHPPCPAPSSARPCAVCCIGGAPCCAVLRGRLSPLGGAHGHAPAVRCGGSWRSGRWSSRRLASAFPASIRRPRWATVQLMDGAGSFYWRLRRMNWPELEARVPVPNGGVVEGRYPCEISLLHRPAPCSMAEVAQRPGPGWPRRATCGDGLQSLLPCLSIAIQSIVRPFVSPFWQLSFKPSLCILSTYVIRAPGVLVVLPSLFRATSLLCRPPSPRRLPMNPEQGGLRCDVANAPTPCDLAFLRTREAGRPDSGALPATPSGLPVGTAQPHPWPIHPRGPAPRPGLSALCVCGPWAALGCVWCVLRCAALRLRPGSRPVVVRCGGSWAAPEGRMHDPAAPEPSDGSARSPTSGHRRRSRRRRALGLPERGPSRAFGALQPVYGSAALIEPVRVGRQWRPGGNSAAAYGPGAWPSDPNPLRTRWPRTARKGAAGAFVPRFGALVRERGSFESLRMVLGIRQISQKPPRARVRQISHLATANKPAQISHFSTANKPPRARTGPTANKPVRPAGGGASCGGSAGVERRAAGRSRRRHAR